MITIELRRRTDDVHAQLKDHPEIWDCGKNSNEAIAKLIKFHGPDIGIKLSYPDSKNSYIYEQDK